MLIKIKVDELTPHPRNEEFFDNITGDNWTEFLKSIETSGVIEPVVCTQDKVIVSGHQRVRACMELGIKEIACDIREYGDEDKALKDLIETNLRQRGIGNPNPVKMGRCIKELERIYGISKGGDRKSKRNNFVLKTQDDFANELGITSRLMQNYKKLLQLIPELQDVIETGELPASVGYKVWSKLQKEEQQKIFETYGKNYIASLTQSQSQALVAEWKKRASELEERVLELQNTLQELQEKKDSTDDSDRIGEYENHITKLKEQIEELQNRPQVIKETVREVVPHDYEEMKEKMEKVQNEKKKLQEENLKVKKSNDALTSRLAGLPADTAAWLEANVLSRRMREMFVDISSRLKQYEQYVENADPMELGQVVNKAKTEFSQYISQIEKWNRNGRVINVEFSTIEN